MFDAAHQAAPIAMAVGRRRVVAVVCTHGHGHNDHVTVAPQLSEALDAPVLLHPGDDALWRLTHPDNPFRQVDDGQTLSVAGLEIRAIHTPGHSPGSVLLARAGVARPVQRRHPVCRRARCDGSVVLRFPHHTGIDLRETGPPTRRHRRVYRPRGTPPPSETRSFTTTNGSREGIKPSVRHSSTTGFTALARRAPRFIRTEGGPPVHCGYFDHSPGVRTPHARWRRSLRKIFPEGDLGIVSMNCTSRIFL